jgi:hypothetical protein
MRRKLCRTKSQKFIMIGQSVAVRGFSARSCHTSLSLSLSVLSAEKNSLRRVLVNAMRKLIRLLPRSPPSAKVSPPSASLPPLIHHGIEDLSSMLDGAEGGPLHALVHHEYHPSQRAMSHGVCSRHRTHSGGFCYRRIMFRPLVMRNIRRLRL